MTSILQLGMKTLLATRLLATISLLLLLVLCSELASAQTGICPDEVTECDVDPCQEQECNRFYSATCVPNFCHGLCTANFFWRGKNVTDNCETVTCDTRRTPCRGTRQCMEMVVPPTCPEDQPVCRQYLRTRCVLMEVDVDLPMTCSDVSCEEGTVCRLRIRTEDFPPVVRCLPAGRVSECVTGTCDDGLTCVDDGPSVQCVATTPSPTTAVNTTSTTPSPTTAVNTTSTTPSPTTAVNTTSTTPSPTTAVNTTSTTPSPTTAVNTTSTTPSPTTAVNTTSTTPSPTTAVNTTTFTTTPSPTTAVNTTSTTTPRPAVDTTTSTTTPRLTETLPTSCEGVSCPPGTSCIFVLSEAHCFPTCEALNCSSLGLMCNETSIIPFCDVPTSCDDVTCPSGTTCTLQFSFPFCSETCEQLNCSSLGLICNETSIVPFCDLPTSCDDITCPSGTTCTLQLSFPLCVPVFETCEQLNCSSLGLICNETSIIPFCDRPTSCDDITCPSGTTCTLQLSFPVCSPVLETCEQLNCSSLGLICNETSIIPFCDRPTSCDDITCPSGTTCTLQLSFPLCVPVFETCEQLNCSSLGLICNETSIIPFCDRPTSCDDITCPSGTTCTLQLSFPVCSPVLETCEQLNCSSLGLICNETSIIPFCDRPTSCDDITCPSGTTCTLQFSFPVCVPVPLTCEQLNCGIFGSICNETGRFGPTCFLPTSCDDITCQPGFTCTLQFSFAFCSSVAEFETCEVLNCAELGLTCNETGILPFCDKPISCDDITCPSGTTCGLDLNVPTCFPGTCEERCGANNLVCEEVEKGPICRQAFTCEELDPICKSNDPDDTCSLVGGVPQCSNDTCKIDCLEFERCASIAFFLESPDLPDPFFCFRTTIARTCDQLTCPPDTPSCYLVSDGSSTGALCINENTVGFRTCEVFPCAEGETCVDLTQDGTLITPFCTILDCAGNDDCSSNDTCVKNIPITPLESTSACIPSEAEPSFTTTKCEERDEFKCEDPFVCQESVLNGRVVGSSCSTPVPIPSDSCDGVECDGGETCLLVTARDTTTAQCMPDTTCEDLISLRTLVLL